MSLTAPLFALIVLVPVFASLLLGAQLRPEYLVDVVRRPRALIVGIAGQYVVLPSMAVAFFFLYPLPAGMAWAWFVLAAAPGGAISNMVTYLGRGRLSLSVVLTACSTVASLVTIPLWLNLGLTLVGEDAIGPPPIGRMVVGSFLVLVVPLGIGITVGLLRPRLAERLRRGTRVAMLGLLVVGFTAYTVQRWEHIAADFDVTVFAGAALFHVVTVGVVWLLGRSAGLDPADRFTVCIEAGVQNVVIAVLIAELLGRSELVPFVGYYTLATFVLALVWAGLHLQRVREVPA